MSLKNMTCASGENFVLSMTNGANANFLSNARP